MAESKYNYQKIRDYLLDLIALKHNAPDTKLPSENQLCAKFGVSRISAKNAIARLQEEGLVYRKQGKGTFIRGESVIANLPARKEGIVCLLLPEIGGPFFAEIVKGCTDFFQEINEQLFILGVHSKRSLETQAIQRAVEKGAKGFIVYPVNGEHYNKELFKLVLNNFPIILIDRIFTGFDISSVTTNNVDAAYQATDYLISQGKKHIGIILPSPTMTSSLYDRVTGYEKALSTNGMPINLEERLFLNFPALSSSWDIPPETFKAAIADFLKANPQLDGLISIGDFIGLDLYRAIRDLGIQVPSRLQVIFFDNEYEQFKDLLPFTPTVIAQQTYTIGYEAARALTALLSNPSAGITRKQIPPKLILGQSTEGG